MKKTSQAKDLAAGRDIEGWDLQLLDLVGKSDSDQNGSPLSGNREQVAGVDTAKPATSSLNFESQSQQLYQQQRRLRHRHIPILALLFIGLLIGWASIAEIDQVTRAQGKVIPTHNVQLVQSLEGGIVEDILVSEGDVVTAQQQLVKLKDTLFQANYQETLKKRALISGRMARLRAEASDFSTPVFEPGLSAEIVDAEMQLLNTRQADYQAKKDNLEELLSLANQTHRLLERGETSVTKVELLNALRSVVQFKGELLTLQTSIKRTALENLDAHRIELEVLTGTLTRDKDKLDRTILRSPMNGIVKKVNVDTKGQVVSSGENIVEIVPMDESLLVQANVRPEDISHVHSNQKALIKFTAYDFIRYGGMAGTVEYIGADTITNDKGETYYPIRIRTESHTMGTRDGQDLSIIPGMVADVDLLAGKKSVLQYLLTPINRAQQKALREQ